MKGHREFPKWRFWEFLKRGTPFLGNPQKPSVYGLFHDFKGKKRKRKKSNFPKNGSLNFIFGDFFPKMGVILGKFPKTREKSPKTRLEIPKNRNRYSFLGDFWEEEFQLWAFE